MLAREKPSWQLRRCALRLKPDIRRRSWRQPKSWRSNITMCCAAGSNRWVFASLCEQPQGRRNPVLCRCLRERPPRVAHASRVLAMASRRRGLWLIDSVSLELSIPVDVFHISKGRGPFTPSLLRRTRIVVCHQMRAQLSWNPCVTFTTDVTKCSPPAYCPTMCIYSSSLGQKTTTTRETLPFGH